MFSKSKIFQNIPNFITILNLVSGALGVFFVFEDKILLACMMIYIAAIFDFLDGMVARMLKATSEIGKSLDSLADVVSFGFLPTTIIFYIIKMIIMRSNPEFSVWDASLSEILLLGTSLLIVSFAALRLANFNNDTRQTYGFIGVPTPSVAILISSFPFIINKPGWEGVMLMKLYVIIPIVFILSFLMVSEISMISMKFKNLSFKENVFKYLLIVISATAVIIGGIASIPVIFLVYIIFSIIESRFSVPN